MAEENGASPRTLDRVVESKLLIAVGRISAAVLVVMLPWGLNQVTGAVRELEQATNRIQIMVARIEERDSRRAEAIDELRRRLDTVERRQN